MDKKEALKILTYLIEEDDIIPDEMGIFGLNDDIELINKYGAVSKEIAILMAEGALSLSNANLTVSVTGVAGPGGGTKINPVGRVHMGIAKKNKKTEHFSYLFENNGREFIRQSTTIKALENILKNL